MEFIPGWTSFYVGHNIELDIMTTMKGLENYTFTECMDIASVADRTFFAYKPTYS